MVPCTKVLLHLAVSWEWMLAQLASAINGITAGSSAPCKVRVWLQFIWGMGAGSASLVRHVSGWTLASISGFTGAFSRVLIRAVVARGQERCGLQVAKQAHAIMLLSSDNHALLRQALPGYIQPGASPAPVGSEQTCASVLSRFKPLIPRVCLARVKQHQHAANMGAASSSGGKADHCCHVQHSSGP